MKYIFSMYISRNRKEFLYYRAALIYSTFSLALLGFSGCTDNNRSISACPTDDTAALVARLGMGAECILREDPDGNMLTAERVGNSLVYSLQQPDATSAQIPSCATTSPFVEMYKEGDLYCTDGSTLFAQDRSGKIAGTDLDLDVPYGQQTETLQSYLSPYEDGIPPIDIQPCALDGNNSIIPPGESNSCQNEGKILYQQDGLMASIDYQVGQEEALIDQLRAAIEAASDSQQYHENIFLPLVSSNVPDSDGPQVHAGDQLDQVSEAEDSNEPLNPLAIGGLLAVASLGLLSWKVVNNLLDSPRANAWRILFKASNLPPEEVGLFVKKIYDQVPKHQSVLNSVNSFLNLLSFGYLKRNAYENLQEAVETADILKGAMSTNTVGKIKGLKTLGKLFLFGGGALVVGKAIHSLLQSDK